MNRHPVAMGFLMMSVLASCSSGGSKPASADEATQRVTASQGGTVTTPGGIALQIDPGALAADTDVRVAAVPSADATDAFVAGAAFGPDGSVLARPARVRIPLPPDWSGDLLPEIHEFNGALAENAMPTGTFATLSGSPGAYVAEAPVAHFSGVVLSQNCHAGTIKHILANFERRGCDRAAILKRVNERYPELGFSERKCVTSGPPAVQGLLDTYFEDLGGWGPGQDIPPDVLARLLGYARAGRQVAFAFDNEPLAARGGLYDFYPSGNFPHSAVLEVDDQGTVQLKNTIFTVYNKLKDWGGGEVVVNYPADRINDFRRLQSGVAVELAICGRPGCLSERTQNNFGIDAYSPLAQRPVPYPTVRVYVERAGGPPNSPCATSTLSALVDVEGYLPSHSYVPLAVIGALGSTSVATGYPGFIATTADVPLSGVDPATQDILTMTLAKNLPGPGTYRIGEDWELVDDPATLVFSSPSIPRSDHQGPVVFVSTTGSLRLKSYGVAVGSSLRGDFEANIVGLDWLPVGGGEFLPVDIPGTVAGSFDVVILDVRR